MEKLQLQQLDALLTGESNVVANLANASALLNEFITDINWVGFYLMNEGELVLGPFQGKIACVHLTLGKGVCGTAAANRETLKIDNVHEFAGHVACDSASNSEVVVPLYKDNEVIGVLDIDSPLLNRFSDEDVIWIEEAAKIIEKHI